MKICIFWRILLWYAVFCLLLLLFYFFSYSNQNFMNLWIIHDFQTMTIVYLFLRNELIYNKNIFWPKYMTKWWVNRVIKPPCNVKNILTWSGPCTFYSDPELTRIIKLARCQFTISRTVSLIPKNVVMFNIWHGIHPYGERAVQVTMSTFNL